MNGTPQSQYGWAQNASSDRPQRNASANGYDASQKQDGGIHAPARSQPTFGELGSAANGKSVAEYRKKAQGAILNLLPYDVRYQTYIDEGFKEDIVGALFDDLKMPRTSSKKLNGPYATSGSQSSDKQQNGIGTTSQSISAGKNDVRQSGLLPVGTNIQQPISKGQSISQSSLSPSINTASASIPVQPKSTTMTEKERTLQTKMEALRKSREERAQKAAAKTNPTTGPGPAPRSEESKVTETSEKSNSPPKSPVVLKAQSQVSAPQHVSSQPPPADPLPQKPPASMQQQAPMIPGLFLASSGASPAPQPTPQAALPTPNPSSQRKRPVAADFDDHLPTMNTVKRPFGYSPHNEGRQSLVIDLSDDEDEDVAMDLDSQADRDSPASSIRKMSDPRSTSAQNIPLATASSRKPFTPPNSAATNTPSMAQTSSKASLGGPDVLLRKQSEIEELKKKIAEAEARKKARQTPSGTRTPRASEPGSEMKDANLPDANLGNKVAASIKMQNLIAIAAGKATLEQQKLANAQAAETEKAAELKRNEAEQKRLRRAKIASDLPLVEAEVLQNQTKLQQLRAEMARIEAAVQKNLEDKRRLAEEMERLGQEAEEQLQEQKDKLNTLTRQESRSSNGMFPNFTVFMCSIAKPRTYPIDPSVPAFSPLAEQISLPSRSAETREEATKLVFDATTNVLDEATAEAPALNSEVNPTTHTDDGQDHAKNFLPEPIGDATGGSAESEPTNQALETALQEAVRAEADSHSQHSDDMDVDVSYAPEPAELAPELPSDPTEEGNRSPEYSPVLNRAAPENTDRESDGYEPPDATAPTEAPESPPFSPAPPESIHEADEMMQDVNSTQALNEPNTAEDAQPLVNGSPQMLLDVTAFVLPRTAPGLLTTLRMLRRKIQANFKNSLLTKAP
jgi:hypothetical protein